MGKRDKVKPTTWQNRIVGHGEEAPDQLLANPGNWRIHGKDQQAALSGVLREVGVVQSVIVNRRTSRLVDGHLRVTLAMREGQPTVPVVYVDLSEEEEALVLATIDPIAAMAGTDQALLTELLAQVSTQDAGLQALLDEMAGKGGEDGTPEPKGPEILQLAVAVPCADEEEMGAVLARLLSFGLHAITATVKPGRKRKGGAKISQADVTIQ